MRVAIDLDGVCYEWDRTARYMLRTYRGCDGLENESDNWWAIKDTVPAEDWKWLWDEGVQRGLFRYGHMVKDTRWALDKLAQDSELVIVTHRPESAVQDTVDWISLYFKDIPYAGLHILSDGQPKSTIDADLLIDDKPANIQDWNKAGRDAFLFDQPWNAGTYTCSTICSGRSADNWGLGHKWRMRGWKEVVKYAEVHRSYMHGHPLSREGVRFVVPSNEG